MAESLMKTCGESEPRKGIAFQPQQEYTRPTMEMKTVQSHLLQTIRISGNHDSLSHPLKFASLSRMDGESKESAIIVFAGNSPDCNSHSTFDLFVVVCLSVSDCRFTSRQTLHFSPNLPIPPLTLLPCNLVWLLLSSSRS